MIALIAFVVTMLPLSAFAEARTSFIRSRIDSRPARPDNGIEIVPHKTENPKRSAIWDGSIAAGFAGGSGTEDDPYLISNGSELAYLAQQVNSGNSYENVHFKLTNDIYLNDTTDWELWGTTGSSSAGKADTLDGSAIEPTKQDKCDKMDAPIAIPVRPAPKTELESDTLSDALNAAGQSNTFVSTGSYPWLVDSTTYDGRTAAQSGNYNISFEPADARIAAVNANGVVTGVSAGETTITVTTEDGGFTGACAINVYNQAVTGVTIEPSEAELTVGSSTKLTATVLPENASNKNVVYSVDDESILSVDQDGNVTGLSAGTATVTVTTEDGGFSASAEITVIPVRVTGVSISPKAASVGLGHTIQLTASIKPSNAANKNLSWSVSDETIISVDDQGTVTGLSLGTATVTVTTEDGGFTASAEITVCYAPANTWTAIGTLNKDFCGVFNGDGYAVCGIYINTRNAIQGLFGINRHSVIVNLGVAESYIYADSYWVGGVVGCNYGTVTNCYNTGSVVASGDNVGGVVGFSDGTVTDCYNVGSVTGKENVGGVVGYNGYGTSAVTDCYNTGRVNGNRNVGGVIGFNCSSITECYNTGNITGSNGVGGVIGGSNSSITDCYNTGSVTGRYHVGGVVGSVVRKDGSNSHVTDCYNEGSITGDESVGGVAGYNLGTVTDCYNISIVNGNERVGGVVGYNDSFVDEGTVTNCYNTGSITGSNGVGGVVGYNYGTVTYCYNTGSVTGDESVGGVLGQKLNGSITNCYYYIGCCASSNSYGTALTNEQMLCAESFEGFDFETVWTMDGNPGYPYPKLINNFQTASPTTDDVVFSIENITAAPGTDVSVAFTVEGVYEAHALTAFVRYDTNMLSVVGNGIVQGNIWQNMIAGGGTIVADAVTRPGQVPFMAIMPTTPFSGNGTIFTMNFHVNESVELGTVIPLELEIREFYYMPVQQTSPTLIPFTSDNGSITAQVYHSVTFVDYDGTVLSAQSVAHGSAAIEPTAPEREGYAFIGWDKDFSNVTEDMTVTAQYSANSYSITYTINGEEYAVRNYEYGAAVSAPEYTVPEGHTFSGWDIPETMPAENLVLDAVLTVNSYSITYTINGEEYTAQTYEFGAAVSAPEYTVPEGHTFSGWNIPETMPAEDLVIDATCTINVYEVTLIDGLNGDPIAVLYVAHGQDAVLPDAPEHAGYIFDRWDGDPTNVTENRTITACYWMNGDVNHDGEITTYDALLIMRYALGLETEGNELIMDFNGDGCVDALDALLVLRRSMV